MVKKLEGTDKKVNKYETTIFVITSAVMKICKVTPIPPGRRLWRGLGGILLPEQFWDNFSQCIVTFRIDFRNSKTLAKFIYETLNSGPPRKKHKEPGQTLEVDILDLLSSVQNQDARLISTLKAFRELRVISEPKKEDVLMPDNVQHDFKIGSDALTYKVAIHMSKFEFNSQKVLFQKAVARICSGNEIVKWDQVEVAAVAEKPKDYSGGGTSAKWSKHLFHSIFNFKTPLLLIRSSVSLLCLQCTCE